MKFEKIEIDGKQFERVESSKEKEHKNNNFFPYNDPPKEANSVLICEDEEFEIEKLQFGRRKTADTNQDSALDQNISKQKPTEECSSIACYTALRTNVADPA